MTCEGVGKGKSLMIDVRDMLLKTKKSWKRPQKAQTNHPTPGSGTDSFTLCQCCEKFLKYCGLHLH